MKFINRNRRLRRKLRVSANIFGTGLRPRISVFRSNKHIYAQAIDDAKRATIESFSSLLIKNKQKKTIIAYNVGLELGRKLIKKGIKEAVFDRGWYSYSGRVKALAEGLREAGIKV